MTALLDVQGLSARTVAGEVPVLRDVSLTVAPGEVHGLVGESGAGKSTIARAVLGILPGGIRIAGGHVLLDGIDLLRLPPERMRERLGRDLALVPQDPMSALNPSRRIAAQITDGLVLKRGLSAEAARVRARELLDEVAIGEPERVMRAYPHQLSGGMRQRVLIAAAFGLEPRLVICDEPTTALDVTVQKQILRLIRRLQRVHGTAVVFVTHDLGVVAQVTDRVSVLYAGKVVEQAATAELFARPRHVYTRALIAANPRHDRPAAGLVPVPPEVIAALRHEIAVHDGGARP